MPNVYELWEQLPIYVKEILTCKCPSPELVRYDSLFETIEVPYLGITKTVYAPSETDALRSSPGGYYCTKCDKPHKTSIARAVEICDECDKYYVPRFRREEYPVRWRICRNCGG